MSPAKIDRDRRAAHRDAFELLVSALVVVEILVDGREAAPVETVAQSSPGHRSPVRMVTRADVDIVGYEPAPFAVEEDASVARDDTVPQGERFRSAAGA